MRNLLGQELESEDITEHSRLYRKKLGFTNQTAAKHFFGAKDIIPPIDHNYIQSLNQRLFRELQLINQAVNDQVKIQDLELFKQQYIDHSYEIMKNNNILPRLNNQGRRPEQVYYSWMRGYIFSNYFLKTVCDIFSSDRSNIKLIGDDDLADPETFKRTPKADFSLLLRDKKIRIEMQSGFTGINDIKKHKVTEAKLVFEELDIETIVVHFDLYNGQMALVKLLEIQDTSINWITRPQMEGQTVFNIDQKYFVWKITEKPISYQELI